MNSKIQIEKVVEKLKQIFQSDLIGIYLYGSSILGNLSKYSDIDIFVLSKNSISKENAKMLVNFLLNTSGLYGHSEVVRPIEVIIVKISDIKPWKYPPKLDFHYGEWMRKNLELGNLKQSEAKESIDLAIVITQVFLASKLLYGADISKSIDQVPYIDFLRANIDEIDQLIGDLKSDTRNVLLTLLRIWYTLENDKITSKVDAANWAIDNLPDQYSSIIKYAKRMSIEGGVENWGRFDLNLDNFAKFLTDKIYNKFDQIKLGDNHDKRISV